VAPTVELLRQRGFRVRALMYTLRWPEGIKQTRWETAQKSGEGHMIGIAKFSIARPDALAPYLDAEMRVLGELKAEGVIKSAYRRAAGPGGYFLLEGPNIDAVRERVDTLPFVIQDLMTLEYDEIYEI
jgi:hypothetical protein